MFTFRELTGYISTVNTKQKTPNGSFVQRIVVNNATGKLVQVVAWGKLIETKLDEVAKTDNVSTFLILTVFYTTRAE